MYSKYMVLVVGVNVRRKAELNTEMDLLGLLERRMCFVCCDL